ncbi:hypothetical protein L873DRAFT_1845775 [Choiromyces venosus 120613-1]|uniref:Uncharacterized protein n=1 Tax=Choiromyces venosus 120613-1 TaxID=1336337 RepID=A0A3N4JEU1_9PEZI|nr:hypothetical protein L873DRAFT_1845775 [Choiromyces venosus 120613-1]
MATIIVAPLGSAQPLSPPSGPKICTHCQRKKPAEDYVKPGTSEVLKTCNACRQGRAAARARDGTKRKRKTRSSGGSPQSRRKTEHSPGRASSNTSSKQAVQQQNLSPSLQSSSSPPPAKSEHQEATAPPPSTTNPQAAPPPPTPLSASSDSSRVRAETINFVASLSRLAQLVSSATEVLGDERLMALADEIHHDWKVDEMATFVDGFLKGAAGPSHDRAW